MNGVQRLLLMMAFVIVMILSFYGLTSTFQYLENYLIWRIVFSVFVVISFLGLINSTPK